MIDGLDRQILAIIQGNFPLTPEPYADLAAVLGVTAAEVETRVQKLKERGIIRRIGGVFDSRRLGYRATLCALKVPPDRVDAVVAIVNGYPGVTHNYLREHEYNMWFTLIAPTAAKMAAIIAEIKARTGCELQNLPASRVFKIKVDLPVDR
ncbi:MAG: AsnC family transcriptional regulator [Heliobacteriaceae bacterium]|nr:AsnC family transcriptional regulator [Heliobacteriaceae bacterium]